jgi:hypothetical protein
MMEAASISETLVNFYQTTRRYNLLAAVRTSNLKKKIIPIFAQVSLKPSCMFAEFRFKTLC